MSGIFDLRFLQRRSNPGDEVGFMVDVDKLKYQQCALVSWYAPSGFTQLAYFNFDFLVCLYIVLILFLLVRKLTNHWLSLKHEVSGDVPFRMSHVDVALVANLLAKKCEL